MSTIINNEDVDIKTFITNMESTLNCIEKMIENYSPTLTEECFLTDNDLSRILHISKRTLHEYRDQKRIPFYDFGGKILYKQSEIDKVLTDSRCNYLE